MTICVNFQTDFNAIFIVKKLSEKTIHSYVKEVNEQIIQG